MIVIVFKIENFVIILNETINLNLKSLMEKKQFSLWLIPTEPYYSKYQEIIAQLATEFNTPIFEPHITLFCGATSDINLAKQLIKAIFKEISLIRLDIKNLAYGASFYKTLFVELLPHSLLQQLYCEVKDKLDKMSSYQLQPHLSLLYKHLSLSEKVVLLNKYSHRWPLGSSIDFNQVKLMTDSLEENRLAVESWQQLMSINLA